MTARRLGIAAAPIGACLLLMGCALGRGSETPEPPGAERTVPPLAFEKGAEALRSFAGLQAVNLSAQPIPLAEGKSTAPILVEVFADYRCPHCFTAFRILQAAMDRWPNQIRLVHRNFPLDGTCNVMVSRQQPHGQSCRAARAVVCAAEQNIFRAMHAGLFDLQNSDSEIDDAAIERIVRAAGGNQERLAGCLRSERPLRSITVDVESGRTFGIEATPTLVIQGKLLPAGGHSARSLFHMFDALVYARKGQSAQAELQRRQAAGR